MAGDDRSGVGDTRHSPLDSEELHRINARRWRVGGALTALMMLGYFTFILLVAFAKSTAGTLIGDVSVGILLGASVIVLAPVLTFIYVRWANRSYDPGVTELARKRDRAAPARSDSNEGR